jgi:hypothetical protein
MRIGPFCSALSLSTVSAASAQVTLALSSPEFVRVYQAGDSVTAPVLLPRQFPMADC